MNKSLFTSESVTEGHPDKICDQISDAILDEVLLNDHNARVACECIVTTGLVLVMGEISTKCYVEIPKIARKVIKEIGYDKAEYGFDCDTCSVITSIDEQSPDIAMGVDKSLETRNDNVFDLGAGDQGMMFGYACDETDELMPMPISYAHKLSKRLAFVRKNGIVPFFRPDGKTQVSVEYENNIPKRIDTIVISTQHDPDVDMKNIRDALMDSVVLPSVPGKLIDSDTKFFFNPTGRFVIGGPSGDSGLTGRKIIVDTYGGTGRHGGGCFSGKDPTKVDRSAAYAARQVAKTIVAAKLAKRCEVQLAYAIGIAQPVSVMVDTFGTGILPDEQIVKLIMTHFDLRPSAIIKNLDLRKPIYKNLASYGHMGREDLNVLWEKTPLAEIFKV